VKPGDTIKVSSMVFQWFLREKKTEIKGKTDIKSSLTGDIMARDVTLDKIADFLLGTFGITLRFLDVLIQKSYILCL